MKIESIPFNQLIGIKPAESPWILSLDASEQLVNHLGTVHAAAQFALAEATSAQVLINRFAAEDPDSFAVVRRVEAKYRAPIQGRILSRSTIDESELTAFIEKLRARGRTSVTIPVEVCDQNDTVGLVASIEWFAQKPR